MFPSKSSGFSLLEILITVLIGSVILNGIFQVILSSKEKFNHQKEMAYMQENARYILDVLSRDIRMAGYSGCQPFYSSVGAQGSHINPIYLGLYGVDHHADKAFFYPDFNTRLNHQSDAIVVHYSGEKKLSIDPSTEHHSIQFHKEYVVLNGENDLEDQTFLLTDALCSYQYVISPSSASDHQKKHHINRQNDRSTYFKMLDKRCTTPACRDPERVDLTHTLSSIVTHAYFIDQSVTLPGALALKKLYIRSPQKTHIVIEEIATGIEDLQFFYGVDVDGAGGINEYRSAEDMDVNQDGQITQLDWQTVRAVRIDFLLTSRSPLFKKPQTVMFNGKPYPGLFMRKAFSATVNIRNAHYAHQ